MSVPHDIVMDMNKCYATNMFDYCISLGGCKHGKVDNSWSMPSVKWKWFNFKC